MFTEYSLWWGLLIVAICFGLTYFFYFYKKDKTYTSLQRYVLSALRFVSLFLILFLFLSPVKKIKHFDVEKPIILYAQDNSSSIVNTKDSSFYKKEYLKKLQNVFSMIEKEDYNLIPVTFGSKTNIIDSRLSDNKVNYKDFATNFDNLYSFIAENYSSQNIATIAIASDGINTVGGDLLSYNNEFNCPIYTIAMGDNSIRKDIKIADVRYNKVVLLNNEYPLEITVSAYKAKNENASLFMEKAGKRTLIKNFKIEDDDFAITIPYKSLAQQVGREKVSFIVSKIDKEYNVINNKKDIYIEVINSKKKILILASAPHPDISAFKSVIEANQNYECTFSMFDNLRKVGKVEDYDMVILHNLPQNTISANEISQILNKNIPTLFVLGQGTNIALFNSLKTSLNILPLSSGLNQTTPSYNKSFSLFTLSPNAEDMIKNFPPLLSPIAKYSLTASSNVLMYQNIGSVSTNYPLIAFSENGTTKTGFITGENIWRWRLTNYLINQTHNEADEIINKTIQLVGEKSTRAHFHVESKDFYSQNEDIILQAQLYNENFELVNTPEAEIIITNKGKSVKHSFGKTNNAYFLNLGKMNAGEYSFSATTTLGNKTYTDKGNFVIHNIEIEESDLVAKHNDLYTLASKTNGKMFYPKDVEKLIDVIKNNQNIKPIIHESTESKRFISLWWYWLLIALTLSGEWFLRKYWGKI